MLIGYARTSTAEQSAGLAAQERDLRAAGAEKVFSEQVSSIVQRAALKACLEFAREGDVIICTKPDRLARSTAELLTIEADLTKRGIGLVILSMGGERLDTRNPTSKLMLTILAGVACWEREIMLERQREGYCQGEGGREIQGSQTDRRRSGGDDQGNARDRRETHAHRPSVGSCQIVGISDARRMTRWDEIPFWWFCHASFQVKAVSTGVSRISKRVHRTHDQSGEWS